MSTSGGCEAAENARTSCGCPKYNECSKLLNGKRFPLKLKGAVPKSYVMQKKLYGSEA